MSVYEMQPRGPKAQFSILTPKALHEELKEFAYSERSTLTGICTKLLRNALEAERNGRYNSVRRDP